MTNKPISPGSADEAVKRERKRIDKNVRNAGKLIAEYDASRAKLPNAERLETDFAAMRPEPKPE